MAQAHQWASDATEKLHIAERAGERANLLLLQTRNSLSKGNQQLDRCMFLLDAIQGQLHLLNTLRASLQNMRTDRGHSFNVLASALESAVEEVEAVFATLREIVVDGALQEQRGRTRSVTLYDFVSAEILDVLNKCQVDLDGAYNGLELELDEQERTMTQKSKEFSAELDALEKQVVQANESEGSLVPGALEAIRELEEEVAALLESITAHYDQCLRGVDVAEGRITDITEQEKTELFAVLAKDVTEVPEVLSDLEEALGDIQERCQKVEEHLAGQGRVYRELRQLSIRLKQYGDVSLSTMLHVTEEHTVKFQSAARESNERCDEATDLISHYQQFIKSYYSLILELERRRGVQDTMHKVIEETQNKLQALQEEDYHQRENFTKTHGSFLPSDLWLGFGNDNPLYDLSVRLNDIPVMNKNNISTAKKVLR